MKIKPRYVRKYHSTAKPTKERNLFEKYEVGTIRKTEGGYTCIEIVGPKKTFSLMSCARPLTIIAPPEVEDGPAIKKEVPLFFVSPMNGAGKIQGADYFAEINGELVAYRSVGRGTVEPL
jgi:hypothetical protein